MFPLGAYAQGEATNWLMYGGKIKFTNTAVWSPYSYPYPHNFHAKVNVSNCNGKLLFQFAQHQNFSSLWHFFDSSNVALLNTNSNNSARIDAVKGNDSIWLILSGGHAAALPQPSQIRMIVMKNEPVLNILQSFIEPTLLSYGQVTAKRDSAYGYWLVYYDLPNNQMVSLPYDQNGFYPLHRIYSDTIPQPQFFIQQNLLEISPNLTTIAMADYNGNYIHLWKFNRTTGVLSNKISIRAENLGAFDIQNRVYSLCFSKSGTKLYFKASYNLNHPGMYQLDLTNWDSLSIQLSSRYIFSPNRLYTFPTLAPDGNVYFNSASMGMTDTLSYSRIINSDSIYQSSNLQDNLFPFQVQPSWTGFAIATINKLPNTPAYTLNPNRYSIVTQNQCFGDSTHLSLYDYQNLDTVVWDFGDGSPRTNNFAPAHLYPAPGLYVVTAFTRYCNRPDTLYYQLEILGNPELPFADSSICRGDSLRLQLPANWQYVWSTGDSTAAVSFGAAGTYSVTINNGCFTATDSFELRIVDPAIATLPADTGFCIGDSLWVDPGPLAGTVLWSDGGRDARWISQAGNYTLSMTNACGTENHSLSVGVYGSPPLALHDTSLCEGRVLRIELPEYWETNYLWQDGASDRIRSLGDSGLYIVSANNPCGNSTDSLQLELRDCNCTLYLPNAFSPNGDGINDQFNIISRCDLREFELLIYDRWGKNIFRSTTISQGWDGRFNGEMLPVGAYAFVIRYMPEGSGLKVDKGVVHLVR